jgi:fatty acid desaturase
VSRLLSQHAAAGRLTAEELDERLDAAYAARTHGELERLLEDLPGPVAPARRTGELELARARLAHRAGAAVIACVACVGIWAAGGGGDFWPIWVILVAAIVLARNAWATFGPGHEARHARRRDRG